MGDEADRIIEDGQTHQLLYGDEREERKQSELRALTLWRPWPHAILYGGKRLENRPWKPWERIIGHFIALHAGMKYDTDAAVAMRELELYDPPADKWCPKGVIVGVARVTGYVEESDSPWFSGPFGWTLDDVVPFLAPVKAKGMQGLWLVDEETKARVRAAHVAALKAA